MISIRLLGGAKKAVSRPLVQFDRDSASISDILKFLQSISRDASLLKPSNLLVVVNGADSAMLKGGDTIVRHGDVVTVVTVVHGG